MKHKPHPESFRILAAIGAAFGLAFLPSAAPAAVMIVGGDISIAAGDTEVLTVQCDQADVGVNVATFTAASTDGTPVKFLPVADDGTVSTGAPTTTGTANMFILSGMAGAIPVNNGRVAVYGFTPGTATVTVNLNGMTHSINVTVTAPTSIRFTTPQGSDQLVFAESKAAIGATLKLDFGYNLPRNASFTVECSDLTGDYVEFTTPLNVPGGTRTTSFGFKAKDGHADVTFTFTEENLYLCTAEEHSSICKQILVELLVVQSSRRSIFRSSSRSRPGSN